jgi:hypothetical protein
MKCKNPKCNKEFKDKKNKKFCSHRCGTQYNSRIQYYIHKLEPKYQKNRIKSFRNYILRNKDKHKEYMRLLMNDKIKTTKYRLKQEEYNRRPEVMERNRQRARERYWRKKED